MCRIVGIARSAYYKWLNRSESQRDKENTIVKLYTEVDGIYGYRRMQLNINIILEKNIIINVFIV
jgi:putative transposase